MPCHYTVLVVSKTATNDEIKAAYRALILTAHPDKGGNPARFQEIQAAWETLRNPTTRQEYDQAQDQQHFQTNHSRPPRTENHHEKYKDQHSRYRRDHPGDNNKPRFKGDDDDYVKPKPKPKTNLKEDKSSDPWRQADAPPPRWHFTRHDYHFEYDPFKDQRKPEKQWEAHWGPVLSEERFEYYRIPKTDHARTTFKPLLRDLANLCSEAQTRVLRFDKGLHKMKAALPEGRLDRQDWRLLDHVHDHLKKTASDLSRRLEDFRRLESMRMTTTPNDHRVYDQLATRASCDKKWIYDVGHFCVQVHEAALALAKSITTTTQKQGFSPRTTTHTPPELTRLNTAITELHRFLVRNMELLDFI